MLRCLIGISVFFLVPALRAAESTPLDAPPNGIFILDRAALLTPEDKDAVQSMCSGLFADTNIPAAVISFEALADAHGADTIEGLALAILNHWSASDASREWNHGVILLICKTDRKARIQMGATFQHAEDASCQLIMDHRILPRFKAGDTSGGIRSGIAALALLLRSGQLPPDAQMAEAQTPAAPPAKPPEPTIWSALFALAMIALMFAGAIVAVYLIAVFCFIVGPFLKRRNWISTSSSSSSDSSSPSDTSSSSSSSSSTSSSSSSSSDGGGASGSW